MKHRYLEMTFRIGKPLAAYFYWPRRPGDVSVRTEARDHGLLVDYTVDGRAIGIEITAPGKAATEDFNRIMAEIHQAPVTPDELAPLSAA